MLNQGSEHNYGGLFKEYIPGLLERAPIEDLFIEVQLEDDMLEPGQARDKLYRQGITEEDWFNLLEMSGDTDNTRAYILIALSSQKRSVNVLNANLITLDFLSSKVGTDLCVGPTLKQLEMQTPALTKKIGEIASAN